MQPLGNACTLGHHALFLELEDGLEVHLGGVDQVVHSPASRYAMLPARYDRLDIVTVAGLILDVPSLARLFASATPPVLLDVRWRLTGGGRVAHAEGHIPG